MLLVAGASQAEPDFLNEAQRAQEAGDYAKAATLFLPLAEKGDPLAQFNLGVLYTQGQIILKDYRVALQWYLAAAEQGHAQAQANLGELYVNGRGVPQDFKKAMRWFASSAKQGNSSAQLHIGEMHAAGQGVPQDYREAIKWYRLAAEQGHAVAHARLGECYENGLGVAQDSVTASQWLSGAANNASDTVSRNAYLAQRDTITRNLASRQQAEEQKQAREEAERVKAAKAARAEAARIAAEQAAIALAAERAKQKADADAALAVQILAYKQANIEAAAARLKAQQEAKAARDAGSARRAAELNDRFKAREAQRRAEINAEAEKRQAEMSAEAKKHKSRPQAATGIQEPKAGDAKIRHSAKAAPTDENQQHPLLHEPQSPTVSEKKQQTREKPGHAKAVEASAEHRERAAAKTNADMPKAWNEQQPGKVVKPSLATEKKRYPAKVELTDEELGYPAIRSSDTAEPAKTPLKQIEWSKKPNSP